MTIPISLVAPFLWFAIFAAVMGGSCHCYFRYPDDPSLRAWIVWSTVWYIVLITAYATRQGWIHWT